MTTWPTWTPPPLAGTKGWAEADKARIEARGIQAVSDAERRALNAMYGDQVHFVFNPSASPGSDRQWFGPYYVWDAADRAVLDRLKVAYNVQQDNDAVARRRLVGDVVTEAGRALGRLPGEAAGAAGSALFAGLAKALGVTPGTVKVGGALLLAALLLK